MIAKGAFSASDRLESFYSRWQIEEFYPGSADTVE